MLLKVLASFFLSVISLVAQPLVNENGWRPAWGLDRIDQREAALNDTYNYELTGSGVVVYVFDSGINSSHEEFTGRLQPGYNAVNDTNGTEDCSGHGTHTASLIGGTTYGVAKQVQIIPVRVLDCKNKNSSSATLFPAIDWIIEHHQPGVPAIVNMSVGMLKSIPLNEAVRSMIADGLIVVGAAGNQNRDACLHSPASEPSIISVGGTDRAELRARYSNYGKCVDIFAPASDLVGGSVGSSNTYRSTSGTSNAAPIVSGVIALMLQENPLLNQAQVKEQLKSNATRDALFNIGAGSQNLLVYSSFSSSSPVPTTTTSVSPTTTVPVVVVTSTTVAPQPIETTTTISSTTTRYVHPTRPTIPLPDDLSCSKPAERKLFYGTPYVCSVGMWISKVYTPGRPMITVPETTP